MENKFQENSLIEKLEPLGWVNQILFGASCCERMLPNFEAFSSLEDWGNPKILRSALDEIWMAVESRDTPLIDLAHVTNSVKRCEKQIPDSSDFGSPFVVAAQHAVVGVIDVLNCCVVADATRIAEVARASVESVAEYLWRVNTPYLTNPEWIKAAEANAPTEWPAMSEIEKIKFRLSESKKLKQLLTDWTYTTPLLKAELKKQQDDLEGLGLQTQFTPLFIDEFRADACLGGIRPHERNIA